MKKLLVSIFSIVFSTAVFSQNIISISKAELESKSLDENLQVKLAKAEINLAQSELLGSFFRSGSGKINIGSNTKFKIFPDFCFYRVGLYFV